MKALITSFTLIALVMPLNVDANDLKSRAERTDYTETSRYADIMEFIAGLQRISSAVKVETFGRTNEGRALPLVILSKPAIDSPAQAARSGKPVVFIMANIHAGEVEGKEATLHLMRDIVSGAISNLLNKIILLIAPIYNADGNEKIDINNRTAQNGPRGGVGTRENARQMDLNRDFIKLESPEARGLISGVFNRWDPHVVIDLHTTNGSYHGYALTYSPSLNPNTDQRLISFARDRMLPDVSKTLRTKYKYRTYFYGNFADERNPQRELGGDSAGQPKVWATFDHRPRFGNNYLGLRNRIAILSEAYSYLDFRRRVDVTDKFVRTILDNIAARATEIVNLVAAVDRNSIDSGTTMGNDQGFGIAFELKASPKPAEILVGAVNKVVDPRTGKPRFEATDEARPVKMTEYGEFRASRRLKPAAEYIFKPGQRRILDLLLAHGIIVEQTAKEESLEVEQYSVTNVSRAARAFQGHRETRLTVSSTSSREVFPLGSFIVSARQSKAALVFYLLEAESDDGFVNWNYFDEELDQPGGSLPLVYPVYRLATPARVPREVVKQ